MNPVIKIYVKIVECLERGDAKFPTGNPIHLDAMVLTDIRQNTFVGKLTDEQLNKLLSNAHDIGEGLSPDEDWDDFSEQFALNAFKDLSTIKNPLAMKTFRRITSALSVEDDMFVFLSKTIDREDGSVVLVLHVSDPAHLAEILAEKRGRGDLKSGMMVYRE